MNRRRRSNIYFYLILNIVVSAATTLAVLMIWDRTHRDGLPILPEVATQVAGTAAVAAPVETSALPTPTNPPTGEPVIEIVSVVGAGDLDQEVIMLKRVGEGNLRLSGWSLRGSGGTVFTFPDQPELVLYKDGAVQVYTKLGTDTATDIYWNRSEPAWRSGETIHVLDSEGIERAVYSIP